MQIPRNTPNVDFILSEIKLAKVWYLIEGFLITGRANYMD
jgi:hypothetical protein